MNRTASRFTVRALALATVPVLLVTGCSSGSGEDPADAKPAPTPTPEPVRFSELPDPCTMLTVDTVKEVVPEAKDNAGKNLKSADTTSSRSCLWSGWDEDYQFRSLIVALKRFDSDIAIGSGDERAGEFVQRQADEITEDEAYAEVHDEELTDAGDKAVSLSFDAEKTNDDDETRDYREQRVIIRTGNVVITLDYSGTGLEDGKTPKAKDIKKAAEKAAREVVESVDVAEADQGQDDEDADGAEDDKDEDDA